MVPLGELCTHSLELFEGQRAAGSGVAHRQAQRHGQEKGSATETGLNGHLN